MTTASQDNSRQLLALSGQIIKDKVCPELAAQATQLVFGDGNPEADIVFIGEAPGKNEDLQGKPFVGAAGKFLDEMLGSIGLKRDDVYITNIVKYRPPNNRDPLPEEKAAFLPYLQTQLEIIQPKIVVTLGRHSMNCFLPDYQISKVHGQPKRIKIRLGSRQSSVASHQSKNGNATEVKMLPQTQMATGLDAAHGSGELGGKRADEVQGGGEARTEPYQEYGEGALEPATQQFAAKLDQASGSARRQGELTLVILPLYHPAAALYNGAMRKTLLEDFSKIPEVLKLIETKQQ